MKRMRAALRSCERCAIILCTRALKKTSTSAQDKPTYLMGNMVRRNIARYGCVCVRAMVL